MASPADLVGVLPADQLVTTHHELCLALRGDETSFTGDLLRLIAKADRGNRARLAVVFPFHVAAWEVWHEADPPLTAAQLRSAATARGALMPAVNELWLRALVPDDWPS